MKNKIFSLSITYNPDLELLDRQIDSLINQVNCIILVDNGSLNIHELETFLKQKQSNVSLNLVLIKQKRNMGLGYAQNEGIKAAMKNDASDVLLLDQDSVLENNFIINLIKARTELTKQHINVGAVGPVYFNELTNETYPITKFFGPFIKKIEPSDRPEVASFLIASGCLIGVDVLKTVGLMNEELFIDCIDIDWSFRAQAMGYKLYVAPQALMMHTVGEKRMNIIGRSIAMHSPLRRYYLFRNSVYMVRNKNVPVGYKIREITFNMFRLIIYFSFSKDRLKYLKYSYNGFKDGLTGVVGECTHRF